MILRKVAARPSVEPLESVTLLSGLAASVPLVPAKVSTMSTGKELDLSGTLHGTYHQQPSIPDVGKAYNLSGSGHVKPMGRSSVTGGLHSTGFIATGHAGGQIFLSDSRGTVTLTLTGPPQQGFANLPNTFNYTVTNASGKFLGDTGSGQIVLVRHAARPKSTPTTSTPAAEHGTFTLVLVPNLGATTG